MLRRHDLDIDESLLSRFYAALHTNLLHAEAVSDVNFFFYQISSVADWCTYSQDMRNALVKHCGAAFFSLPLPGSTLLVQDFVVAAKRIGGSSQMKEVRVVTSRFLLHDNEHDPRVLAGSARRGVVDLGRTPLLSVALGRLSGAGRRFGRAECGRLFRVEKPTA